MVLQAIFFFFLSHLLSQKAQAPDVLLAATLGTPESGEASLPCLGAAHSVVGQI